MVPTSPADVIESLVVTEIANGPMAELARYTEEHYEAPTLSQWLQSRLPEEQLESYKSILTERFTTTEKFPVSLDKLWPELYPRKDNAKRQLLANFTIDADYKVVRPNAERVVEYRRSLRTDAERVVGGGNPLITVDKRVGGQNKEDIFLTLRAAQKFALQSHTSDGSKVADFFVDALAAVQDYHILTVMYEKNVIHAAATEQALLDILGKGKKCVYIIDLGVIDGVRIFKFGYSDHLKDRLESIRKTYPNPCKLLFAMEHSENIALENAVKAHETVKDRRRSKVFKGENRTELFENDETLTLPRFIEIIKELAKDLETHQQLVWAHEEKMKSEDTRQAEYAARGAEAGSAARVAEAEAKKIEYQYRIMELDIQKTTLLNVAVPPEVSDGLDATPAPEAPREEFVDNVASAEVDDFAAESAEDEHQPQPPPERQRMSRYPYGHNMDRAKAYVQFFHTNGKYPRKNVTKPEDKEERSLGSWLYNYARSHVARNTVIPRLDVDAFLAAELGEYWSALLRSV